MFKMSSLYRRKRPSLLDGYFDFECPARLRLPQAMARFNSAAYGGGF
jgi:hypothetical protein